MEIRDIDPFAVRERAQRDDPFAGAVSYDGEPSTGDLDRTVTLVGPLAQRDPGARADESAEFPVAGEVSFDDLLRGERRRGFLAGCGAGALAAALVAVALASGTDAPTVALVRAEPRTAPSPGPEIAVAPPTSAQPAATAPPTATAPRAASALAVGRAVPESRPPNALPPREPSPPARAAAAGAEVPVDPGLDLRSPEAAPPTPEVAPPPARADAPADADAAPATSAPPDPLGADADRAQATASEPGEPADPPARTLEEGEVAAALALRRDAIDACVAATVTTTADAAAAGSRYLLVLTIEPSGQVSDARVDDPAVDATPLGACLVRIARGMSFEPFDGGPVRVELPLRLAR